MIRRSKRSGLLSIFLAAAFILGGLAAVRRHLSKGPRDDSGASDCIVARKLDDGTSQDEEGKGELELLCLSDVDKYPLLPPGSVDYAVISDLLNSSTPESQRAMIIIGGNTGKGDPEPTSEELKKRLFEEMPSLTPEILSDYEEKNRQGYALGRHFDLSFDYHVMGEFERDRYFSSGMEGWRSFREDYPGADRIWYFTRVGLSKDKKSALLHGGAVCGELCGHSGFALLVKEEGKWKAKESGMNLRY